MNPSLRWIVFPLLLTACGTPHKPPPLPDGSTRHAINTPARINEYRDQQGNGVARMPTPHDERIAELEAQIAALHTALAQPLKASEHTGDGDTRSRATVQAAAFADDLASNEAVQLRPRSILFSIPFTVGDADFTPSMPLRGLLLRAAEASPRIEVRGRTDAETFTPAERALALRRAAVARDFLASHGIAAARLHATALASGDHTADNSTAAGKARNRRVDIEVMDIDPMAHAIEVPTVEGEQHEPD